MEKTIQYMLVMEVTPIDGRKFKGRKFINVSPSFKMTSQYILDQEVDIAKVYGVSPSDVLTVNVVKLQ